jgi:hypothetical protein
MEGDLMEQKELVQLIEKWESTEPIIYKTNLKNICKHKGKTIRDIESFFNISFNTARSYINPSHTARIPFLIGLKLAEFLEINVEKLLENI